MGDGECVMEGKLDTQVSPSPIPLSRSWYLQFLLVRQSRKFGTAPIMINSRCL